MEPSGPIIRHSLIPPSKLSGIRHHLLCLRSHGSRIWAGTSSFHSTATGSFAGWFEWLERPAMAQCRPCVWGLCCGCWPCSLVLLHVTPAGAGISKMASSFACLLSAPGRLERWGSSNTCPRSLLHVVVWTPSQHKSLGIVGWRLGSPRALRE